MKPLNEYGSKEWRIAIKNAVKDKDNWYFSQTREAYYADYRPSYPQKTNADFTIVLDHSPVRSRLTVYADTATIPIINQYSRMEDLLDDLRKM